MSSIRIRKIHNRDDSVNVFQRLDAMLDEIRCRAFAFFEARGGEPGRDLDDWFAAEREILWTPPVEVTENEKEFRIRVMAPGYELNELEINAMPDCIVIQGEQHQRESESGELLMAEFGAKRMFRRLELPASLDLDKVTATLVNGMLRIVATKAAPAEEKRVFVTTSHAA